MAVAALFVQVDRHLRPELAADTDAAAALRLRLGKPVTVHVEEIVIRPSARPRLVVLGVVGHRVEMGGASLQVLEQEARPTVGVLHRIDEQQRLAQDQVDIGIAARGQQVIGLEQGRVGRRDFVAMHPVRQPHDHGVLLQQPLLLGRRLAPRVGQPLQVGLHGIERRDASRRAHDEHPQRTPLPAPGVLDQPRAGRVGLLQGLQVGANLFRRGDFSPRVMPHHLSQGGDGGVIRGTRPERLGCGLGRRRQGRQQGQDEQPCAHSALELTGSVRAIGDAAPCRASQTTAGLRR